MADDVIRFMTPAERAEKSEREYAELVHDEAIDMLRRAREFADQHPMAGLAIVFITKDGHYGRILPRETSNMAGLIGALGTAHHDLILQTLTDFEERKPGE